MCKIVLWQTETTNTPTYYKIFHFQTPKPPKTGNQKIPQKNNIKQNKRTTYKTCAKLCVLPLKVQNCATHLPKPNSNFSNPFTCLSTSIRRSRQFRFGTSCHLIPPKIPRNRAFGHPSCCFFTHSNARNALHLAFEKVQKSGAGRAHALPSTPIHRSPVGRLLSPEGAAV